MGDGFSIGGLSASGGNPVEVKAGQSIEDIKRNTGLTAGNIWDDVDKDGDGVLDEDEVVTFKKNLRNSNYIVNENSSDGPSPNAFNQSISNEASRYDKEALKGNFSDKPEHKHKVVRGDTLTSIVDAELDRAGIPKNNHTRHALMAQIKALNNIRDINNIKVGTELIVRYTPAAVSAIKNNNNDNRAAMGGSTSVVPQTGDGKTPATGVTESQVNKSFDPSEADADGKTWTEGTAAEGETFENGVKVYTKGDEKVYVCEVDGGKVKFDTLDEANAFSKKMADEAHNLKETSDSTLEGFTAQDPQPEGLTKGLKVYTKSTTTGTGDDAKTETETKYVFEAGGKKVVFDNEEKAKEFAALANPDNKEDSELTEADLTKALKAYNAAALSLRAQDCQGNLDILKGVVENLKTDGKVDLGSDEVKALVKELVEKNDADLMAVLATKEVEDPDSTATPKTEMTVFDDTLFDQDPESLETFLGLYKDLRTKELNGEKLSDNEHALVDLYNDYVKDKNLGAAGAQRVDENGDVYYAEEVGGVTIKAASAEALAKFKADYNAKIGDDAKKHEIFTEYANTDDKYIRQFLAEKAETLAATKDDILGLIEKADNKLDLISHLTLSDAQKTDVLESIASTVLEEFKAGEKPDPANMMYLDNIFTLLGDDATEIKVGEEQEKDADGNLLYDDEAKTQPKMKDVKKKVSEIKQEIIDSFFTATTTKDENNNDVTTYSFDPSRMPTKAEMTALLEKIGDYNIPAESTELSEEQKHKNDLLQALVDYIKPEHIGGQEFSDALEVDTLPNLNKILVEHYGTFVSDMNAEDVLKLVEGIYENAGYQIPYDQIIDRFSNEPQVMKKIADCYNAEESIISPDQAMTLAKALVDAEYANNDNLNAILDKAPADDAEEADKTAYTTKLKEVGTALIEKAKALGISETCAEFKALQDKLAPVAEGVTPPTDAEIRDAIKALNTAVVDARAYELSVNLDEPAADDTEEVKTAHQNNQELINDANSFLVKTLTSTEKPGVVTNPDFHTAGNANNAKRFRTITVGDKTITVKYNGTDNAVSEIRVKTDKGELCYYNNKLYYATEGDAYNSGNGTNVDYAEMNKLIDFVKFYFGDWKDPEASQPE